MKLARIGLIIVLLVAIGSPVKGEASDKQRELVKNATGLNEAQKVVWDYFEAYISWLYDFKKGDETVKPIKPILNRSLDSSYVEYGSCLRCLGQEYWD